MSTRAKLVLAAAVVAILAVLAIVRADLFSERAVAPGPGADAPASGSVPSPY